MTDRPLPAAPHHAQPGRRAEALRRSALRRPGALRAALPTALALLAAAAKPLAAGSPGETAPARVVTLAPHLAELVCAAAGCEVLVAVTAYSDFPPEIRTLPVIGDAAQVNVEALLALAPTHVFAWEGGTPLVQRSRLAGLGVPVTALGIQRIEDVPGALLTVGRLLGSPVRAQAAAARFSHALAALRAQQSARQRTPLRVLYQIETAPVYSVNRASPISEAITLCGGVNVFADLPTLAAPVSDEAVLAARPAVVIHAPQDSAAVARYWGRFAKAASLMPTRVAIDPDLLARAGPRLIDGVQQLCAALDAVRASASAPASAPVSRPVQPTPEP